MFGRKSVQKSIYINVETPWFVRVLLQHMINSTSVKERFEPCSTVGPALS